MHFAPWFIRYGTRVLFWYRELLHVDIVSKWITQYSIQTTSCTDGLVLTCIIAISSSQCIGASMECVTNVPCPRTTGKLEDLYGFQSNMQASNIYIRIWEQLKYCEQGKIYWPNRKSLYVIWKRGNPYIWTIANGRKCMHTDNFAVYTNIRFQPVIC